MKKMNAALVLCCLMILVSAVATACGPYVLIPDSDTRQLTERELNAYSYDALGYALNEIVARHGYHFKHDGKYYDHFSQIYEYNSRTGNYECFYTEAPSYLSNQEIYDSMTRTEMRNMSLIKDVRAAKKARGEYTGEDYGLWMCSGEYY